MRTVEWNGLGLSKSSQVSSAHELPPMEIMPLRGSRVGIAKLGSSNTEVNR